MKARASRRRGGAALVALVCLSVMGVVVVGLLRVSKARADQLRRIEWQRQADWLVEAGLERAAVRLKADPTYDGETWSIPADSPGLRAATVVITIATDREGDGEDEAFRVLVRADYPSDGAVDDRVRRSKTFGINPTLWNKESRE
ncbi:hypothetical protein [Tautonia marina]|uniref:hypothetical protein n=1 Tax=Tautonia marina TaxID=2653855 RepID=UPI001260B1A6|nr:hypothetical protein [Tautonia marina]